MSAAMRALGLAALLGGVAACGGRMETSTGAGQQLPSLTDVSDEQWAALADRPIFFGHQSVGANIMDGIADVLADHPRVRLTVLESKDLTAAAAPAFHHAAVGRNYYPLEKLEEFVALSAGAFGQAGGVAMLKLCFVDLEHGAKPESLFVAYRERMDALRRERPELTLVHFTMPLTVVENWKGYLRKRVAGRPTERELNARRHRYNTLVREAYAGVEPLFDIARLESTLPGGGRTFLRRGADTVPVLAAPYTYDGSHLNAMGRRLVAEQLLIMLARLGRPAVATGSS